MRSINTDAPCPHCSGKGFVIVKSSDGKDEQRPCPVCRGSKKSDGIIRK